MNSGLILQLLSSFVFFIACNTSHAQTDYHEKEVFYSAEDAAQVFIVWGINGWRLTPEQVRKPETFVSDNLLHTPLERHGEQFTGSIRVPNDSTVNYIFWITKLRDGTMADIFDTNNGKNYRSSANSEKPIIEKQNTQAPSILTEDAPGVMKNGVIAFIIGVILWTWTISVCKSRGLINAYPRYSLKVLLVGICAYGLHISLRSEMFTALSHESRIWNLGSGHEDWQYLTGIVGTFLFLGALATTAFGKSTLFRIFLIVMLLSLCAAVLNTGVVQELGRSFNYRWLYYSGFLASNEAKSALAENTSLAMLLNLIFYCGALLFLSYFFMRLVVLIEKTTKLRGVHLVATAVAALLFAGLIRSSEKVDHGLLENPIVAFASSVIVQSNTALYSMELPEDVRLIEEVSGLPTNFYTKIPNIVVVVLESAAAQYLDLYGGKHGITPQLSTLYEHSRVFENFYAHAPSTNKSLFAMLSSIYPLVSYTSITNDNPRIDLPSIVSELKNAGYRTSYFASGDYTFSKSDEFINARGFDLAKDYRAIKCSRTFQFDGFDDGYGIGIKDSCLVPQLEQWINGEPNTPFFSMLWTNQAHYPYFVDGEERDFGVSNLRFNRYLNALAQSDAMIGDLVDLLKSKGLFETTLIAVIGDHGEAFKQHGQTGHATEIYEENVRIPMILINPVLFHGERVTEIGEMIDLAPTLLNIAHLPPPHTWQGESLLNDKRSQKAFFFSPWSDYLFGARIGNYKAIFNETNGKAELYDLATDAREERNLAGENDALALQMRQEIAARVQYQEKLMQGLNHRNE